MRTIEQMLADIDSQGVHGAHVLSRGNGCYAVRFVSGMYHDALYGDPPAWFTPCQHPCQCASCKAGLAICRRPTARCPECDAAETVTVGDYVGGE